MVELAWLMGGWLLAGVCLAVAWYRVRKGPKEQERKWRDRSHDD